MPLVNGPTGEAWLRRGAVFGATLLSAAAAALALRDVLSVNGLTTLEQVLVGLFVINFLWIALSFWSAIAGFVTLWTGWRTPGLHWPEGRDAEGRLRERTAILMPVYNEDPARVYGALSAMRDSLAATGQLDAFDFFVLSDTTDPDVWVAEEIGWAAAGAEADADGGSAGGRLFYRKRRHNIARKAGNIADFCRRWGLRYNHMVVLDADSVMTGEALVGMVRLMQANPRAGIIQVPPAIVNRNSLFARLQQFASRVYGPVYAAGLAFWQLGDGNYWGHNAIIRVRAFIDGCGLPTLPGKAPFGGHILSHDFVEAALIRRAGWRVWMVPELGGSYEECPPTMLDFAKRDRRWAQGNLQHLAVLPARGLHPISRLHLLMGIMSYLASPIWLVFLVVGLLVGVEANIIVPRYFPPYETLFPEWPVFDRTQAISLFAVSMGMLLTPKLLGLALLARSRAAARGFGGTGRAAAGMLVESVISALVAPAMMLFHSRFVADILLGRDSGWTRQNRDGGTGWGEALARHAGHMVFGAVLATAAWFVLPVLLWWLSPLLVGLALAVPLAVLTGSERAGLWLRRRGLLVIPEETAPPAVLTAANARTERYAALLPPAGADGLARVLDDPAANAVHLALLAGTGEFAAADPEELAAARAKLDAARAKLDAEGPAGLSPAEKRTLLYDPATLTALHHATLLARPAA
jgi:membrane glycosyltransferase